MCIPERRAAWGKQLKEDFGGRTNLQHFFDVTIFLEIVFYSKVFFRTWFILSFSLTYDIVNT